MQNLICILILSLFIPLPAIFIVTYKTAINYPSCMAETNKYLKYIYPIAVFVISILLYFIINGE